MQGILSVQQILRQPEHTALIKSLLANPAVGTRAELVQEVCQRLNLCDPKGDWRVGTTMKALRNLESQGWWTLPATTQRYSGKWDPTRLHRPVPAAVELSHSSPGPFPRNQSDWGPKPRIGFV